MVGWPVSDMAKRTEIAYYLMVSCRRADPGIFHQHAPGNKARALETISNPGVAQCQDYRKVDRAKSAVMDDPGNKTNQDCMTIHALRIL